MNGESFGLYSRENPPPFVDEAGNFVAAEFVCNECGAHVNVAFHPALLMDMHEVQEWLAENAPCKCLHEDASEH